MSALSFLILFFGPSILTGDLIAYWLYSSWWSTNVSFPFIVVIVITFMLALISGIPTFLYERKKIKKSNESGRKAKPKDS